MLPKVQFLLPVWGLSYARRLATFGLAALAAPGNLPALAAAVRLEVVILTDRECQRYLQAQDILARLAETASITFVEIDDLLVGGSHYAVPLTMAYWRGIQRAGDDMVNTHFVFMNADFVLADGALATLANRILEGQTLILTSNMRCNTHAVEADLLRALDLETGVLPIPPRRLVRIALDHEHATEIVKTVNSPIGFSSAQNQFFWRVDADTVISHHYLCFMLCLRPEVVVREINGFCDYAFVPELCPSGKAVALDDSDDFCMIELQDEIQESHLLRIGSPTMDELARGISDWTTAAQRSAALSHQIVFHADDLPPTVGQVAQEAREFMRQLDSRLSPEPRPYRHHPYWTGALRARQTQPAKPLEVPSRPTGLRENVRRRLFGQPPRLSAWRPEWLDYRPIVACLDQHRAEHGGHGSILYLTSGRRALAEALAQEPASTVEEMTVSNVYSAQGRLTDFVSGSRTLILLELDRNDMAYIGPLVRHLPPLAAPGARIVVFIHDPIFWRMAVAIAFDMRVMLFRIAPVMQHHHQLSLAGGEWRKRLLQAFQWLRERDRRNGPWVLPFLALAMAPLALLARWENRRGVARQDGGLPQRDCSSFVLTIQT